MGVVGWCDGPGKLRVPGRPTIGKKVGQGPIALAVGAGGGCLDILTLLYYWGWSGGAMVLGKLPVPGRPTVWMIVGQGPIVLAVGAVGGGLFGHFYSPLSFLHSCLSLGDGPI